MLSELINSVVLNSAVWLWAATAILVLLLARGNQRRTIIGIVFLAAFWISGTSPFARFVLQPLESMYAQPTLAGLQNDGVKRVVVLTGGGYTASGDLASAQLPHASTFRFLAWEEICQRLAPDCELIFSGSAGQSNEAIKTATIMQDLATTLTPTLHVMSEAKSNSTFEHPQNVKAFVQDAPFVLVTSAYHMPRAMLVFQRAGLSAIPYPVDYYTYDGIEWSDLLPTPHNWEAINLALHEYIGILVYSVEP